MTRFPKTMFGFRACISRSGTQERQVGISAITMTAGSFKSETWHDIITLWDESCSVQLSTAVHCRSGMPWS